MTMKARPTRTPLNPGESRTWPAGPYATITISAGVDCYSIVTLQGTQRVDAWCGTFATHTELWEAYKHTYRAFHTHGTAEGIERRRQQIIMELGQQGQRARRRMHNPTLVAALEQELAGLEDLHTRKLAAGFITHVTNHLAA